MNKKQAIKKLQNLFSWNEFYRKNERTLDQQKTQNQIDEHIKKYKL